MQLGGDVARRDEPLHRLRGYGTWVRQQRQLNVFSPDMTVPKILAAMRSASWMIRAHRGVGTGVEPLLLIRAPWC